MILAFDLDGTLADIKHRLHWIRKGPGLKPNWAAFFAACSDDVPNVPVVTLCKKLRESNNVIQIWSGRSDAVRLETEIWLDKFGVRYDQLFMRRDGDYRADDIVKAEWFTTMPPNLRPHIAFDDRQRVVDMWRRLGVTCCQVAEGNF